MLSVMLAASLSTPPTTAPVLPDLNPFHDPTVISATRTLAGLVLAVGVAFLLAALVVLLWGEHRSGSALDWYTRRQAAGRLAGAGVLFALGSLLPRWAAGGYHYHPLLSLLRWAVVAGAGVAVVLGAAAGVLRLIGRGIRGWRARSPLRYRRSW
ncbi:MAG TPA: hypothetical protein VHL53_03590 [Acidimicrobiia bacterium]|nr:hypothetical protein [Acidimicrobiia bacterium]